MDDKGGGKNLAGETVMRVNHAVTMSERKNSQEKHHQIKFIVSSQGG